MAMLSLVGTLTLCVLQAQGLNLRSEQGSPVCSLAQEARADVSLLSGQQLTPTGCSHPMQIAAGAQGVDHVSLIRTNISDDSRLAVWVSSYPRSGSSTVLSLVSSSLEGEETQSQTSTFSLFEPCHDGDEYDPWKKEQGCASLLWGLSRCDFSGVKKLWGWADPHSSNHHVKFEAAVATDICQKANLVAFKTVDYGHHLEKWTWMLNTHPHMKIVDVVRDPRGIWASWKTTEPFATLLKEGGYYTLEGICENFAKNLDLQDTRIHHIVFERLMDNPWETTTQVFNFLGLPFGDKQKKWINSTFNAKECPEPKPWEIGFTDCHTKSASVSEKWREVLTQEEIANFNANPDCRRVVQAYGFSP
eukprot:CAMPEP_0170598762 /NCGR_PEP_ID=MMETSP0224-20130122/16422_1 /TAXON_ID=285029 /ORGANISM="Togula jolla, Strain CCCM 725" /LENGTH=360 /DNA_ID=CAMNT_0010923339 /DNA_START=77 /DNA_END=1159 /DNA_ORIENTATION=-